MHSQTISNYGERARDEGARINFPTYGMRITYSIDVTRTPVAPDHFLDEDEVEGFGPVDEGLCVGPDCEADLGNYVGALPAPFAVPCWMDGCPDYADGISGQAELSECESLVEDQHGPNWDATVACDALLAIDDVDGPSAVPDSAILAMPFWLP
jgi:hypothetical protein